MAEFIANTKQEMLNGFKLACTITAADKVAFLWTSHLLNVISAASFIGCGQNWALGWASL